MDTTRRAAMAGLLASAGRVFAGGEERGQGPSAPVPGRRWRVALGEDGGTMDFVSVPVGRFAMGSETGTSAERPVHEVTIAEPFWMLKTETTGRQYRSIAGRNPSSDKDPGKPVTNVTWFDAVRFCETLTQRERRAGRLPETHAFALPSEAQWEYACRAGTTGPYAGELDLMGWCEGNCGGRVQLAGRKRPNRRGLYDMHGNVWEWCYDDWHSGYLGAPCDGSAWGMGRGSERVLRGGSWARKPMFCRSASRFHRSPNEQSRSTGFRPVLIRARWR